MSLHAHLSRYGNSHDAPIPHQSYLHKSVTNATEIAMLFETPEEQPEARPPIRIVDNMLLQAVIEPRQPWNAHRGRNAGHSEEGVAGSQLTPGSAATIFRLQSYVNAVQSPKRPQHYPHLTVRYTGVRCEVWNTNMDIVEMFPLPRMEMQLGADCNAAACSNAVQLLADLTAGFACYVQNGFQPLATTEIKGRGFQAAKGGDTVVSKTSCLHAGARTQVWETMVQTPEGVPIASFRSSLMFTKHNGIHDDLAYGRDNRAEIRSIIRTRS